MSRAVSKGGKLIGDSVRHTSELRNFADGAVKLDASILRAGKSKVKGCWSASVSVDDKHRPQEWGRPSSTVRREWCRSPQEAHLLEPGRNRYRRLSVDEIAVIQGFDPAWVDVPGLTRWQKVAALGNSVPPPLAKAMTESLFSVVDMRQATALELCAGIGGLASGVGRHVEHLALIENDPEACSVLRSKSKWANAVLQQDLTQTDFRQFQGRVGLLSGGPPCQPWSNAGAGLGPLDERDLLGSMPDVVAQVCPEVFVFENVPGLLSPSFIDYVTSLIESLRKPRGANANYGVMAAVFNAADYGVPQVRRRVFIVGIRGAPNAMVHRVFDQMYGRTSHRVPTKPRNGKEPWVTLREAFSGMEDPGGWRTWL